MNRFVTDHPQLGDKSCNQSLEKLWSWRHGQYCESGETVTHTALLNVDEGQRLQATWLNLPGLRLHCRDKCD